MSDVSSGSAADNRYAEETSVSLRDAGAGVFGARPSDNGTSLSLREIRKQA
jgi:hypothetical protein